MQIADLTLERTQSRNDLIICCQSLARHTSTGVHPSCCLNEGKRRILVALLVMIGNVPFAVRAEYSGEEYSGG
jgi:hypothetical protein